MQYKIMAHCLFQTENQFFFRYTKMKTKWRCGYFLQDIKHQLEHLLYPQNLMGPLIKGALSIGKIQQYDIAYVFSCFISHCCHRETVIYHLMIRDTFLNCNFFFFAKQVILNTEQLYKSFFSGTTLKQVCICCSLLFYFICNFKFCF